ncbi:hypothetical protein INT46_001525 [Mucor plumbeus]|uniref:F-box domain-containing protein n=1 Tax=Mucor plumbeus TaxID=97098 RepID=A0A8H7QCV8_9FUNG|nr:hypothetical protein INT46_001525 [Mucor plumbeus]
MWNTIPKELYLRIINYINDPKQLEECRLVCTDWNHPDVKLAQHLSHIALYSKTDTSLFYKYMSKHPKRDRFIKHISLENGFNWNRTFLNLMDLVFTPNLEVFEGNLNYNEDFFYYKINTIEKSSSIKHWKLKAMPQNQKFSYMYFKTLLTFKDTLEHITLDLYVYIPVTNVESRRIVKHLKGFTSLRKLSLMGYLNIQEIGDLLQECCHIEELYLEPNRLHGVEVEQNWRNVVSKKMDSLNILKIGKSVPIYVVKYLMSICPNVETIELDGRWDYPRFNHEIFHVLGAIKHVPYFKIKYMLDEKIMELNNIVDFIKADRDDASVEHFINIINAEEIYICSNYKIQK